MNENLVPGVLQRKGCSYVNVLLCVICFLPAYRYISDIPGLLSCCYKQKKASSEHSFFYFNHSHVFNTSEGMYMCNLGALQEYLSTVMTLQYTEKPDYTLLKAGLHESLQKMGGSLKESLNL